MSIKRVSLIAAVTAVAAMAMATSAYATLGASLTTTKADPVTSVTAGKANPGGLFLDVTNCEPLDASCVSSGGNTPTQTIDGILGIDISYSSQVSIAKSKQPTCSSGALTGLTFKNALIACNGSMMGTGGATVCIGGLTPGGACSAFSGRTIVFRGPDFTDTGGAFGAPGKIYPALNLYADIGIAQAVVPAILIPANTANKNLGYKTTLHVFGSGDPVTPPSQSITDFYSNVSTGVKTKCGTTATSGSVNILYQGQWDVDGGVDKSDSTTQACTYVP